MLNFMKSRFIALGAFAFQVSLYCSHKMVFTCYLFAVSCQSQRLPFQHLSCCSENHMNTTYDIYIILFDT